MDSHPYAKRLAEIRKRYPRAYISWTAEEEERLLANLSNGVPMDELANLLERRPSAIRSRLRKLGKREELSRSFSIPTSSNDRHNDRVNHNETPSFQQSIQVLFQASWHQVEAAPSEPYHFPDAITKHMLATYRIGCVYRWAVYLSDYSAPDALYIGSTKNLCPDRLGGYIKPSASPTNQRIHDQLQMYFDSGYRTFLEILQNENLRINNSASDFLDFETQRDRLFVENLLLTYYRLNGIRLLNL